VKTPALPVITVPPFAPVLVPDDVASLDALVRVAGHAARQFPAAFYDALVDFGDDPGDAGAVVFRHLPIGPVPATPPTPTSPTTKNWQSEALLLAVARRLGQPVGYAPEHGGDLVQNIVPVATSATRQISTSSKVTLMFHTETAFHPFRPRYVLLLCLRGDPAAATTLASSAALVAALDSHHLDVLFQDRFRTAIDESHLAGGTQRLGPARPVFHGDRNRPTMVFDADLMMGIDPQAIDALQALTQAVEKHHVSVTLQTGDLLVVDNYLAVHGRSVFAPRFDGTDRWLQRTFVVSDLAPSAGARQGRVLASA
jgi:L-asparagine oxygenase